MATTATSTSTCSSLYSELVTNLRDITVLEGVMGLVGWDEMVLLPPGSSDIRSAQKQALTGVIFEKSTSKTLGNLLSELREDENNKLLSSTQQRVVELASDKYKKATALPKEMATRISALESEGYHAWITARQNNDFSLFSNILEEWINISRKKAELIDPSKDKYDVLLDTFERSLPNSRLEEIFGQLKTEIPALIKAIKASKNKPKKNVLVGEFNVDVQAKLCETIALNLGFDKNKGRLDVSVHPFTGGSHPSDVRMTTRFKLNDISEGLTGAIHETGHSLYEQGRNLNEDYRDLPISEALSMGAHESQSLLWERMVALSLPFQSYLLGKLTESFPDQFKDVTPEELYESLNTIKDRSVIRVESDEVTYCMHIVLRWEIESALIKGEMEVKDVPKVWNAKMKEYLDVDVENDTEGCLQDIHWSGGAYGYFPTYTLGAMAAWQIFEAAGKELATLNEDIKKGEFAKLREWLLINIHSKGSSFKNLDDLLINVTGRPLDSSGFIKYLKDKYAKLYSL